MNSVNKQIEQESDHLELVTRYIKKEIDTLSKQVPSTAAYDRTAESIDQINFRSLKKLEDALPKPYFWRVDFNESADGKQIAHRHYIGHGNVHIPRDESGLSSIIEWADPLVTLYFNPEAESYVNRLGNTVYGEVTLVRDIEIEQGEVKRVSTRYSSVPGEVTLAGPESSALDDILASPQDTKLTASIETIQPEQYKQIAQSEKPVMIIQGAAGSGKSKIGLERILFILSDYSVLGSLAKPSGPRRVIFFGPSAAFLDWMGDLLPEFGHLDVNETTPHDWLEALLSKRVRIERSDKLLNRMMSNRSYPSQIEFDAELFKGSKDMASILDRFKIELFNHIVAEVSSNSTEIRLGDITIPNAELIKLIRGNANLPLNNGRSNLSRQVINNLFLKSNSSFNPDMRGVFTQQFGDDVNGQIDHFWSQLGFEAKYLELISNPERMCKLSRGHLDTQTARQIMVAARDNDGRLQWTDLEALVYIDGLFNGSRSQGLEHILIDEAQDVSPLMIKILQQHSRNQAFTIQGDIRQKLFPYRGVNNWRETASLFNHEEVTRIESQISYRSTFEITRFSNRILKEMRGATPPPQPYPRHGNKPTVTRSTAVKDMYESIVKEVNQLQELGHKSIGVLTKWSQTAKEITSLLKERGIKQVQELSVNDKLDGNVIVSPILLTKGLEFDAVIIPKVDAKNFPDTDFDRRLLYLGCTRAKHNLSLYHQGRISAIVPKTNRL